MFKTRKVALYIRVSTYEQAEFGFSLEAQLGALQEYCRANQWLIHQTYTDEGISGKRADTRPALQHLLDDAEQGLFQMVLVWKISRLARNALDLLEIVERLKGNGVSLRSLTEPFETETPLGQFTLQMMSAVGELERKTISENMRLGRQRRNRLGKYCGSRILGYEIQTTEYHTARRQITALSVVPEEAALVQHIFTLYAQGLGFRAIMNRLNLSGFTAKEGNAFSINTVRQILRNVIYIGKIRFRDPEKQSVEIVQGEHEPLLPHPLWEKVQLRLRKNSCQPKKKQPHEFILTSVLRCPACGSGMIGAHKVGTRKNGSVKRYVYYICSKYHNKGTVSCKPNYVSALTVENEVLNRLKQLIFHPKLIRDIVEQVNRQTKMRLQYLCDQLQQIEKQLKESTALKKQLFEFFELDQIGQQELSMRLGSIKESSNSLDNEKARLKHEFEEEQRKEVSLPRIQKALEQFELLWQPSSISRKRGLLRNMIEKVIIGDGKSIQIHLKEALLDIILPLTDTTQYVS